MKLSQPKSAREINTCRVLCTLRENPGISRADLSRCLSLNKVSIGEIVKTLSEQEILKETERNEILNGRRPSDLFLVADSRLVLAVDIGPYNISVALCNLLGSAMKIERFPLNTSCTIEEFCVQILKSCMRTIHLVEKQRIIGAGITIDADISEDGRVIISASHLPWKDISIAQVFEQTLDCSVIVSDRTAALVKAEKRENPLISKMEGLLYLNWSQSLRLACVSYGHVFSVSTLFGDLNIGGKTLNEVCSSSVLGANAQIKLKDLWENVPYPVFYNIAQALNYAYSVTGFSNIIISGEGATISDSCMNLINENCLKEKIDKSSLGERAYTRSAAELALDNFFYRCSFLEDIKEFV